MTTDRTPTFTADEMEAIRKALAAFAYHEPYLPDDEALSDVGLPESVIAWVLGEPPVPCQTCGGTGRIVRLFSRPGTSSSPDTVAFPCPTCRGEQ